MALIPLETPLEWGFDTTANQVILRLQERDAVDPNKVATREAIVRLNVASVNLRNVTPPT